MSKAILVMDMPTCCNKCPIEETDTIYCQIFDTKADYRNHNPEKERPDWCPLKEISQKKQQNPYNGSYEIGFVDGYNACIDEILKGSD